MLKAFGYQFFGVFLFAAVCFAEGEAKSAPSAFVSMAPIILLFVVFYFLLIRPQQKKAKEHKEMLSKLQKGDNVMTNGGIFGKIIGVSENSYTIEVANNVSLKVAKEYIASKKP
ncbi:MAG: preprotein translocase subunit YajC [Thermodesulfobacteriota bacterium]